MDTKVKSINGSVGFQTQISIEELAEIISKRALGGALLTGKEKRIYDDIDTLFNDNILGFRVILQGPKIIGDMKYYNLSFQNSWIDHSSIEFEWIEINNELFELFKNNLSEYENIIIIKAKSKV